MLFPKKHTIFTQGDPADAVFYLQTGKVRLTVVSKSGKEATIGILSDGSFFGEGSLAGQLLRMGSATAMTDCAVLRIEKKAMVQTLHREQTLSDLFVAYLLARNIRYEEDLVDQLFNSSEKRLARILLLLARFGKEGVPETVVPTISQETLAEMIGTTRSRVSFFMNRFRKIGIHSLQRRAASPQFTPQRRSSRLASCSTRPQKMVLSRTSKDSALLKRTRHAGKGIIGVRADQSNRADHEH
jgi:CRP-like cAMP-binding protein